MRIVLAAALIALAAPALAGHANPWSSDEDSVNSKNHEENQTKSEATPGEDEMLGVMVRKARGKLDSSVGNPARE